MEKEKDKAASLILSELLVKTAEWEGKAATSEIMDREAAVASAIVTERKKAADEIVAASTTFDAAEKYRKEAAKILAAAAERDIAANKARKEAADVTAVVVAAAFQAEQARKEAADKIAACPITIGSSTLLNDSRSDQAVEKGLGYEVVTGEALDSRKSRLEPEARQHLDISTATTKKSHPLNTSSRKSIRSTNAKPGTQSFSKWRKRKVDAIVNFLISLLGIGWHK